MSKRTKIEWCDHSASPWIGCTKVSEGCAHCYAETLDGRGLFGGETHWGKGKPRYKVKTFVEQAHRWNRAADGLHRCSGCGHSGPLKTWLEDIVKVHPSAFACCPDNVPRPHRPTVFPSLCDWLDDEVPIEWLADFLQLIHETPNLNWLLLTKRPENWLARMEAATDQLLRHSSGRLNGFVAMGRWWKHGLEYAPANIWIGTSVENQRTADLRIPELLKIPARGRFLSLEPLLGPLDLHLDRPVQVGKMPDNGNTLPVYADPAHSLHWLIIGGESGKDARPCNVEWIRSLVQQGKDAGVVTFVKQLVARPIIKERELWRMFGQPDEWTPGENFVAMRQHHPKGGDPAEWPEDLRVRQFPEGLR